MPIPKPTAGQTHDEFIEVCMGDDVMVEEYPDEKQRYAVCQSSWDKEKKSMDKLERRSFTFEIRADDQEPTKITGHAAVFNTWADIWDFKEQIAPGAFRNAIKKDDVRALFNHDPNFVLGRNRAGTLKLAEDDIGLAIEIIPPDTQFAKDLMVSLKRGDITQMSFGFNVIKEEWNKEAKPVERTIKEVQLWDISPVTFPAYPQTDVSARYRPVPPADVVSQGLTGIPRKLLSIWKLRK